MQENSVMTGTELMETVVVVNVKYRAKFIAVMEFDNFCRMKNVMTET